VRKRIGVNFYESYATHYLQVSKVFVFFIFLGFQQLFHYLLNFVDDAILCGLIDKQCGVVCPTFEVVF
jgi:hypothetical protein